MLLFISRFLYCSPCRYLRTSQVPVLISVASLTFATPVRDECRFPDLVPAFLCCLLRFWPHLLSQWIVFGANFVHPMRFRVSARQFLCLRFVNFVTSIDARLDTQRDRFPFCDRTFTCKISQALLGAPKSQPIIRKNGAKINSLSFKRSPAKTSSFPIMPLQKETFLILFTKSL